MNSTQRIPVCLVTGFLGSGKTTMINEILRDPAFAGALVVVNEFGEVGLDHLLVSSADDQVVLLSSGCLCCAASGTLRDTLIDLLERRSSGRVDRFTRVIVETSGLVNPGPLVATLLGDTALAPRYELAGVLTLVDGINGTATLEAYEEARLQVAFADQLVMTKTEAVEPAASGALRALLRVLNPHAPIDMRIEKRSNVDWFSPGRLSSVQPVFLPLTAPKQESPLNRKAMVSTHGASFERLAAHTLMLPQRWSWPAYAMLTQVLSARLGKRLLRCKGLLAIGDEGSDFYVVQGVQGYFASPRRLDRAAAVNVSPSFLVCITDSVKPSELELIVQPFTFESESHCL